MLNKKWAPIPATPNTVLTAVLCFYTASLYFAYWVSALALLLFVIAGVATIAYAVVRKEQKLQKPHAIVYCWLAVYAVRLLWLPLSDNPAHGAHWLDGSLPFLLLPVIFQYIPITEQMVKTILTFFLRFTLLFCVATICVIVYISHSTPIDLVEWLRNAKAYCGLGYMWTGYDHPSYLSVIYLLAIPAGFYLRRRYGTIRIAELLLLIGLIIALMLFTAARIAFVLFPLLIILLVYHSSLRWNKIITVIMAVVLVVGGVLFMHTGGPLSERFHDTVRTQLRETAIASIKEKPLLGTGTGGMLSVMQSPEIATQLGYSNPQPFSYPHNQYLGEVMHFGIIGSLALFLTIAYLLFIALRRKDLLLQAALLSMLVLMFTEMPFDSNKAIHFFLLFSSLQLAVGSKRSEALKE
jgi:hypothetical protein